MVREVCGHCNFRIRGLRLLRVESENSTPEKASCAKFLIALTTMAFCTKIPRFSA
jgi:hypothetical protein